MSRGRNLTSYVQLVGENSPQSDSLLNIYFNQTIKDGKATMRPWVADRIDNNSNANGNNNVNNNNGRLVGIVKLLKLGLLFSFMSNDLYAELCSYENLELAFRKARKGKTLKPYVVEFEAELKNNLTTLRNELLFQTYKPRPLGRCQVHCAKALILV